MPKRRDPTVALSEPFAKWLIGIGRLEFSQSVRFGHSGSHHLRIEVSVDEIREIAANIRASRGALYHVFQVPIPRGRGTQQVPITVSRSVILGIADAIDGAADLDDAGHRFWHWDHPDHRRPCDACRETRDTKAARDLAARSDLVSRWSGELRVESKKIEHLLAEYDALPRR